MKKRLSCIFIIFVMLCGGCMETEIEWGSSDKNDKNYVDDANEDFLFNNIDIDNQKDCQLESVVIEQKVIYQNNNVVITITGIEQNIVSFLIENNSELNLGFNMHSYAVNGIMTNNNIYDMDCDVASNSRATAELKIDKDFLSEQSIKTIKTLSLHIWAYDNDKAYKSFDCGIIKVETSASDNTNNYIENTLCLDEGAIQYGYAGNKGDTYYVSIYNETDNLYEFDVNTVVVDGWTYDISYAYDLMSIQVHPYCQTIVPLEIKPEFLSESGIGNINSISMTFDKRIDADYYNSSTSGKVVINVQ